MPLCYKQHFIWDNVDPDLCRHMTSPDHNELGGSGVLPFGADRLHFIAENSGMEWRRFILVMSFWIVLGQAFVVSLGIVVTLCSSLQVAEKLCHSSYGATNPITRTFIMISSLLPNLQKTSVTERICVAIIAHISRHWNKEGVLERVRQTADCYSSSAKKFQGFGRQWGSMRTSGQKVGWSTREVNVFKPC